MNYVKYDFGFMFKYSERPGTPAYKKLDDNVPDKIKQKRLQEIIDLQQKHSFNNLKDYVNYYWHIDKLFYECEKIIEKKATNYLDLLTVEHTVDTLIKIASWNIILD